MSTGGLDSGENCDLREKDPQTGFLRHKVRVEPSQACGDLYIKKEKHRIKEHRDERRFRNHLVQFFSTSICLKITEEEF